MKRKYFFTQCIIKSWKSFPQDVEDIKNTNKFKDERCKFMQNACVNAAKQDDPVATCSENHSIAEFQKKDSCCPGSCQDMVNPFQYPGGSMGRRRDSCEEKVFWSG